MALVRDLPTQDTRFASPGNRRQTAWPASRKSHKNHERIYQSLLPLRKVKELHRRRIARDTAKKLWPSMPEPAIRNRISHPIRDNSSCTPTRPRVGVCGCVRIRDWPRRPWKGTSV